MDKHYGWQEGRGAQVPGRQQNGQRWNEQSRDVRGARGGEYGGEWDQDDRRWASPGGDLDREQFLGEDEEYGSQQRGNFASRGQWNRGGDQGRWSQSGYNRGRESSAQFGGGPFQGEGSRGQGYGNQGSGNQGYGSQGFSGGHYGGFANEGFPGQGNYGGNRGFSNQGYSGPPFNQGSTGQSRGFSGQGTWNQSGWGQSGQNYGQRFGQGYAGPDEGAQGFGGQGFGNQSYAGQGSGNRSYTGRYQGRGFAGRGPKGYQRSDERIKEQISERLMDDDDIDASEITLDVKNGEATLTGTVRSREEKRAAEEIAEQSPGVREVQNHLRVTQETSSGQSGQFGRGQSASAQPASSQSKSRNTDRE